MVASSDVAAVLAYVNDVLQSIIVIFGVAVVLYNVPRLPRGAVIRSFSALISFVVLVYLAELLVSRAVTTTSAEVLLRLGWIGVAMVPAAQFHLSDALLGTTGKVSPRRRRLVIAGYLSALAFALLGAFTDVIVGPPNANMPTPRLTEGPYFLVFTVWFWGVTVSSVYNVWRARARCLTRTTRNRMSITLLAILAAPLGVFPYTLLMNTPEQVVPIWLWLVLILGNLVVSILFAFLTSQLVYFGAMSPDRVVRVRLYKFMARVPLAATIVLLVFVLVSRAPSLVGLPKEVALGFAIVATVMIVEWIIHAYKKPLERVFQLNDDPDVRRIQTLSERLLTTSDLQQFLESVLAAMCEALRTPSAFVAALNNDGAELLASVGPLGMSGGLPPAAELRRLERVDTGTNGHEPDDTEAPGFYVWGDYWIQPLYSVASSEVPLGILGIRARPGGPQFTPAEAAALTRLTAQASSALEDRLLQLDVFAAVEGLLPELAALQEKRRAATFGGLPVLTAPATDAEEELLQDPEFNNMVRDALTHYWGGPKLTESPLLQLQVVQRELEDHDNNPVNALRAILVTAIEQQRPDGQRNLSTTEWILYNILELKFIQGRRVRDVARRLAMSESDLYRKQRVAIENVARTIANMERVVLEEEGSEAHVVAHEAEVDPAA
jgi:hypothetical protein